MNKSAKNLVEYYGLTTKELHDMQEKAKLILDTVKLTWEPNNDEFLMDWEELTERIDLAFTDDEYDAFFVQGHDMTGSPGTEEQMISNMLSIITSKYIPDNIVKQTGGKPIAGWNTDRKHGLLIDIKNNKVDRYPYPETWIETTDF